MPVVAAVVRCKKCDSEIRSDWKFCPNCGDHIMCTGKYEQLCAKKQESRLKRGKGCGLNFRAKGGIKI